MSRTLRVLHLEDSPADSELVRRALQAGGLDVRIERVGCREAFTRALREFEPDVVLSDHSLSAFDAREALRVVQSVRPAAPVILVSYRLDEETVVACLRAGAEDFVMKGDLTRLVPAIESALPVRRPLERLSPRQLEVLRLVAEGHTTREIARRLKLSVKTIETHRGEVMKRLNVHDLVTLTRYAVRIGLVAPDS